MSDLNFETENELIDKTYVSINIADDMYGIPVGKVQEVLGVVEAKHVPNSQPFMKGIINLRGVVVPLVDMRVRFGLPEKEHSVETVILIVQVFEKLLGLIVDSISDVVNLEEKNIQKTPHFPLKIEVDCILGIGQKEDKTLILMNVDKVFTKSELDNLYR